MMNELDRFIKEINLVFTNTIQAIDFCRVGFDLEKRKVNYENAINMYKLVSSFNKLLNEVHINKKYLKRKWPNHFLFVFCFSMCSNFSPILQIGKLSPYFNF